MALADSSSLAISSLYLAAFSRSAFTTASGARETNFSLESFCSTPRRPFWAFSISLRIRYSSAAMSTSSLRGR